jgi:micrococcal nuclease
MKIICCYFVSIFAFLFVLVSPLSAQPAAGTSDAAAPVTAPAAPAVVSPPPAATSAPAVAPAPPAPAAASAPAVAPDTASVPAAAPAPAPSAAAAPPAAETAPVAANQPLRPEQLVQIDKGTIQDILKTDIILMSDNKRYKLDNIRVPIYEDAGAQTELRQHFLNREVTIYTYDDINKHQDRYGMPVVHVVRNDGAWLQEDLVARGLAWAVLSDVDQKLLQPLYDAEAFAREKELGFWKQALYRVKSPYEVENYMNSYQVVEGVIINFAARPGALYFDFGKDWKTDFTIKLSQKAWSDHWSKLHWHWSNPDPEIWKGTIVRVHGWVEKNNGPMIDVGNHLEQIEIIKPSVEFQKVLEALEESAPN